MNRDWKETLLCQLLNCEYKEIEELKKVVDFMKKNEIELPDVNEWNKRRKNFKDVMWIYIQRIIFKVLHHVDKQQEHELSDKVLDKFIDEHNFDDTKWTTGIKALDYAIENELKIEECLSHIIEEAKK